jgi:DNA-binding GntR family transcriptional regulator
MNVTFPKISPVSKKDSVVRLLKESMATGAITCGDQIIEVKLARQLGVGQGLVREALFELEREGFVHRTPFSNTRVATLSDQDARHIFDIRIQLEPLAFELAARSLGSKNEVVPLRALIAQSKNGANSGDLAWFFRNHLALFRKVWELSGNKFLHQTLERLVDPLFVLYLTRASFTCEALMQEAIACSDRQEQILQTLLAGEACGVKRMVSDFLIQMKAIIESKGSNSGGELLPHW